MERLSTGLGRFRWVGTVLFHTCMSFGLLMQVSVLNVDWAIGFGAAGKATSVDGMASVFCWSFADNEVVRVSSGTAGLDGPV